MIIFIGFSEEPEEDTVDKDDKEEEEAAEEETAEAFGFFEDEPLEECLPDLADIGCMFPIDRSFELIELETIELFIACWLLLLLLELLGLRFLD